MFLALRLVPLSLALACPRFYYFFIYRTSPSLVVYIDHNSKYPLLPLHILEFGRSPQINMITILVLMATTCCLGVWGEASQFR